MMRKQPDYFCCCCCCCCYCVCRRRLETSRSSTIVHSFQFLTNASIDKVLEPNCLCKYHNLAEQVKWRLLVHRNLILVFRAESSRAVFARLYKTFSCLASVSAATTSIHRDPTTAYTNNLKSRLQSTTSHRQSCPTSSRKSIAPRSLVSAAVLTPP
jgi:hypothetical protein